MIKGLFCSISICFSIAVFSQEKGTSFTDSLSLEKFVIESTRANNSDPLTFQNINVNEIEEINIGQDPVVLIQELSSSIVTYSDGGTDIGNYSQLRMRGIDQSRINMSLNGVPLNDMVDQGTYFSNFSDFGNSIQSIQIQRGAGSIQKGTASYGGAINFESTNIFTPQSKAEAQVTVGSFGTLRTAGEFNSGTTSHNMGFYGRMTRISTDGYKYNSGSGSYSMFFSGGKLFENSLLKVTAFSGKTQNGQSYLHVPLDEIMADPRTNYNDHNDIDDFEQSMVQLQYSTTSDNINYNVTAYYNGAAGVFPFTFAGDQYMYGLENDHYGAFVNRVQDFESGSLTIGIHGYLFDRSNFEYISPQITSPYTRDFTDKNELNIFTKYVFGLNDFSFFANAEFRTLSMNIRGDSELGSELDSSNSWSFLNGSIGLNYVLNDYESAYLSMAHTNREPARSDLLNGVDQSESVLDLEIGWKKKLSFFIIDVNVFLMSFKNEISNIGALEALSYIEIRQNVENSKRYGIESSMKFSPNKKWSSWINMAWMDTNIEEYNTSNMTFQNVNQIFSPHWILQPGLSYNLAKNTHLRTSARYVSDSFTELSNDKEFILPSHVVANLQLDFLLFENLKTSLVLNNVFNKLYFTEGGPIDVDFDGKVEGMGYRIQPPRHFYIMLNYVIN